MKKFPISSPEQYLNVPLQFEELAWQSYVDLSPGVSVRVLNGDSGYLFQCTSEQDGGKRGFGSLYRIQAEGNELLGHNAEINLAHPIPFLNQQNIPSVELTINKTGNDSTRIQPIFTSVKRTFDQVFHDDFAAKRVLEKRLRVFLRPESKALLGNLLKVDEVAQNEPATQVISEVIAQIESLDQ